MTASRKIITGSQAAPARLEPSWFYLPKLGPFERPIPIPVAMSRFVAKFRAEYYGGADERDGVPFLWHSDARAAAAPFTLTPDRPFWPPQSWI